MEFVTYIQYKTILGQRYGSEQRNNDVDAVASFQLDSDWLYILNARQGASFN